MPRTATASTFSEHVSRRAAPARGAPAHSRAAWVSAPAIEFLGVVKRYGEVTVLDGLDLAVPAGKAFALVGANGAGKTTCIKTVLDFGVADAGTVRIFGEAHTQPAARSRLSFLPERFMPPFHLTGMEFLAYAGKLQGVSISRERACRVAAELDLDPQALARPARSYSKGMAQKLGLASSLLADRELLVLDEPMSGLDPKARLLVKRQLVELKRRAHTLFFSTHVLSDVHAVCDLMAIVHRGKARFVGSPEECLASFGGCDLEQAYLNCIDG